MESMSFLICSYIQEMTLDLINTSIITIYNTTNTKNTKPHFQLSHSPPTHFLQKLNFQKIRDLCWILSHLYDLHSYYNLSFLVEVSGRGGSQQIRRHPRSGVLNPQLNALQQHNPSSFSSPARRLSRRPLQNQPPDHCDLWPSFCRTN